MTDFKENVKLSSSAQEIQLQYFTNHPISIFCISPIYKSFEEGIAAAAKHKQQSVDIFKNFKAKDAFKNYTESPDQANYYGGVDQTNSTIKEDAASLSVNSEVSKSVYQASENQKSIDKEALANQIKRISQRALPPAFCS